MGLETGSKSWFGMQAGRRARTFEARPPHQIPKPNDIANPALFLANDGGRRITGQSINCDAGAYTVGKGRGCCDFKDN